MADATDRPAFLFVNKTAKSKHLSRSTRAESFNLLSHVRRSRPKTKRANQASWQSYASVMSTDSDSEPTSEVVRRQPSPLSMISPTGNEADPFFCTVAGDEGAVHQILRYSFSAFSTRVFLAEAFAPADVCRRGPPMRHSAIIAQRLEVCVADAMVMYSTLAMAATGLALTTGDAPLSTATERFTARALPAVRARLARGDAASNTWLLLSVYALAVTQMWQGVPEMWANLPMRMDVVLRTKDQSRQACRTHFRALKSLIGRLDGWTRVEPYLLESMILCDKFLAIYERTRPMIPLAWDPGPTAPANAQGFADTHVTHLTALAQSFTGLGLRTDLLEVIHDLAGYIRTAEALWGMAVMETPDERWLFLRLHALVYRLLLAEDLGPRDDCVRLTSLLFVQHVVQFEFNQACAAILQKQLKLALTKADERHALPGELRLWCLCTGGMVRDAGADNPWFLRRVNGLLGILPLTATEKFSKLQPVLSRYLFVPDRQARPLMDLSVSLATAAAMDA